MSAIVAATLNARDDRRTTEVDEEDSSEGDGAPVGDSVGEALVGENDGCGVGGSDKSTSNRGQFDTAPMRELK